MAAPNIFKDETLQKQFDEIGFVKIALLNSPEVEKLRQLFSVYYPDPSANFYSSSYEDDYLVKKKMSDEIGAIMVPNLEKIFIDYTWFGSAFLSKGNGSRSEMPMHQDWTIVDENKFLAMNIWTPLQDTNEENGTIEVIEGSHRWHNALRAPTLPFYFDGYQHVLKSKLTPLSAKGGEAVVLNQAIIHYSKPNLSKDVRIAITSGIKTKDAPMLFHYWDKNKPDHIEMFKQEDDFLIRFENFHQSIFRRPDLGESLGVKSFQLQKPTKEEVDKLMTSSNNRKSFAEKIIAWARG